MNAPPEPKTEAEIPAYVDAWWKFSIWARICYGSKEKAIREVTEVFRKKNGPAAAKTG